MENEFNNYHINNPDGTLERYFNEGKLTFGNDGPRFISEHISSQKEILHVNESTSGRENPSAQNQSAPSSGNTDNSAGSMTDLSSLTNNPTVTTAATGVNAAAATSAIGTTVTTAIGSGLGAIAGVVASAVATAVIVVAVFISTLSVNLSLVMADMDCLIFRLEMQGAQEQDFENGVYALLDGSDGSHYEQQLNEKSVYVSFTDLKPNQEYIVRIQSGEKVFIEQSFITASSRISRGTVSVRNDKNNVFIDVNNVVLGTAEIYTLTVTDPQGSVLFVKDDKQTDASYSFTVSEPKKLHCNLSIGGVTYAFADAEVGNEPTYDFNAPAWSWTGVESAALSFAETNGGEALTFPTEITSAYTLPTCEEDGYTTYTAIAEVNGKTYSDSKVVTDEGTATGHDYSDPEFIWTPLSGAQNAASNDDDAVTILGYAVAVKFYCTHNHEHVHVVNVDSEDVRHEIALPSCIEDGFIIYYASVVYNEVEYEDEHVDVLSSTGHAYGVTPVFVWEETQDGYTATANFVCANNEEHVIPLETIVTPSYTEPTCEEDGYLTYTATATDDNGVEYTDTKIVIDEETAFGHDYSVAEYIWTPVTDDEASGTEDVQLFTVTIKFHCSHDDDHVSSDVLTIGPEDIDYSVTPATCEEDGKITYYAFLLYHDNQYRDEHEVVLPALGHDYGAAPVFTWTEEYGKYSVTAAFICANDEDHDHDIVLETDISLVYTEPTCEEDGYTTFTATATDANGVEYTDTKIVINEETATGHAFEADGEWVDNGDGTFTVTAIITCENCSFHDTYPVESTSIWEDTTLYEPATCESDGQKVYNAGFDYNGNGVFSLTHTVVLSALGHDYGAEPVFAWTEEYGEYSVTAAFVCANDRYHDHDIVLESEITSVETSPVTCTEDGYTTYTATATYDGQEYTDVKVVPGESAPGHGTLELTKASPATFSQSGVLKHYTCPVCGKHYAYSTGENEIEDVVVSKLTQLDGKTFTAWESEDSMPTDTGNYYLTSNVELGSTWEIGANKEINICLNGHTITVTEYYVRFLNLGQNATFGLYECPGMEDADDFITGYYWINKDAYNAELTYREDYFERQNLDFTCGIIYGGYISGCHLDEENGAVIYAQDGSVTNLKGGTIVGNTTNTGCGGVYYSGPGVNATVHLDGTNLIGNTACNVSDPNDGDYGGGGAIYNENGVVTMSAGRLLYNSAYRSTAIRVPDPIPGVEGTGVFTMTGGEITETNVNIYADSSGRDGVIVIRNGTFNMSGGSIEYNNAANAAVIALVDGEEDGVPYSGTFNMSGGTLRDLDNNNSYLVLVGNSSHTFIVSGNVNINVKTLHPNVYLASGATITIEGALTGQIKVTMEEPGVFTSGYSQYHPAEGNIVCFASDSDEYGIKIIDGELALVECFTVDFDYADGDTVESQTVLSGEYAAEPTMPTQEGFTFLYWYLEEDPDTPFDFENTPIDESITLYAKWEEA